MIYFIFLTRYGNKGLKSITSTQLIFHRYLIINQTVNKNGERSPTLYFSLKNRP